MLRPILIVALLVTGVFFWWLYQAHQLPPGVQAKGPEDWTQWVYLAGSLGSIVSAAVTTTVELLKRRKS
jgi:hypothetical protein